MDLTIKGRHLNLTPAHREFVEKKLYEPVAQRLREDGSRMEVEIGHRTTRSKQNELHVRVSIHTPRLASIHLTEEGDDLYGLVNTLHDRVVNQFNRAMEKRREHDHASISGR